MRYDEELKGIGDRLLGAHIRRYQILTSELIEYNQAVAKLQRDPKRPSLAVKLLHQEIARLEVEIRTLIRTPVELITYDDDDQDQDPL